MRRILSGDVSVVRTTQRARTSAAGVGMDVGFGGCFVAWVCVRETRQDSINNKAAVARLTVRVNLSFLGIFLKRERNGRESS
jgi:hypothetical protein